jgi:cell division protein FtsA
MWRHSISRPRLGIKALQGRWAVRHVHNCGIAPTLRRLRTRRVAVVAALDVGTSKITCLFAQLKPHPPKGVLPRRTHAVKILGFGHISSRGIKAGTIFDFKEVEEALRQVIALAERSASLEVESIVMSVSAGCIASEVVTASVNVAGTVSSDDVAQILSKAYRNAMPHDRATLHLLPIGYTVDNTRGIRDPRTMPGCRLGVDMHIVSTDATVARNLILAVQSCHVAVGTMAASPYMAGLSVLADDEADVGAAVVDMGAGTTTMAVFHGGRFVHADGFAVGGRHVTMDLARGLSVHLADAERLKIFYGMKSSGDMMPVTRVDDAGHESEQMVLRSAAVRIVRPRIEEILEIVRDRLAASPFAAVVRGRVVLTGGASQLPGLPELASRILDRPVRIGRPLGIAGLPQQAKGPAFAAVAGLLVYPQVADLEYFEPGRGRQLMTGAADYIGHFWTVASREVVKIRRLLADSGLIGKSLKTRNL